MQEAYYEARAMKPIQFDSLGYFNELKAADVPDAQAQAQAKALHKVLEDALAGHMAELATKSDLSREIGLVRKDMETEFASVRKDMETEFASVRKDMEAGFAKVDTEIALIRKDMGALEQRVNSRFDAMEQRLINRVGYMLVGLGTAVIAAVKYL